MLKKLRQAVRKNLINIPGWRTDRKIVIIESDDWGMIRMASKESYDWFLNNGYNVDQCAYNKNDAIESNRDLELLFEVLRSVKDTNGDPAVFTANNIVANPDFKKIRDSGFQEYYCEPLSETLKKHPGRDRVLDLYKRGIEEHIFRPQFHGREHLNVNRWMYRLTMGDYILMDAFQQNMFTVHRSGVTNGQRDCMDAFGMGYPKEWVRLEDIITTGLTLFEDLWGYRSLSFIAPCYVWAEAVERIFAKNGIKYIQGTHVQRVPSQNGDLKINKKYHYTGQKNQFGQQYLVRNVIFEPAVSGTADIIDETMKQIGIAFRYKKPAIISSHRVNYIGSIRPENRNQNLELLGKLLTRIVREHPNVEFMSSDQLGELMTQED